MYFTVRICWLTTADSTYLPRPGNTDRLVGNIGSHRTTLRLNVPLTEVSNGVYGGLYVAGDTVTGSPTDILITVQVALEGLNP